MRVTEDHKIMTPRGWVVASNLSVGDRVQYPKS